MSRTIHLSNGIIVIDPATGQFCHSITIADGFVTQHDSPLPENASHIDLEGGCAIPSFIDSHLHLVLAATGKGEFDLHDCDSKGAFHELLQSAKGTVEQGEWLVGSGWSEQHLGERPDKTWFPQDFDIPTICYRTDFHTALVNSALIHCIDVEQIEQMTGGQQIRDGIVMEDALFHGVIPAIPASSLVRKIRLTRCAVHELHREGITLVGSMEHKNEIDSILIPLQKEQCIRMRIMCMDEPVDSMIQSCKTLRQDDFLQITGFKSFLDGTLGSRSAKMYSDWNDAEGRGVWTGHALKGTLKDWISSVVEAGFSPVLHAIGDEAVGHALSQLSDVNPMLVPRIEHAQCIAQNDFPKLKDKWFGIQPLHQPEDALIAESALGSERSHFLHNWKQMIDAGAKLSFGSDWPVAPPKPLQAIAIAIKQGVTPKDALVASTKNGALSLRSPQAGHLGIGAYGDIAILDYDPLHCDWKKVLPSVTMTLLNGNIVYTKE